MLTRYKNVLYTLTFMYIILIASLAYIIYQNNIQKINIEIDKKLLEGAKITATILHDYHQEHPTKSSISFQEDLQNTKKLTQIANTLGLAYVYSFILDKNNTARFASSSATQEELENNDSDIYSFDAYYDKNLEKAFLEKREC